MLCSNKIYGVPYINGYAFPIDNLFSSYNWNQGGKETQVKIVEPNGKGEKIKINTKQGKWAMFKLTFIPGQQPFNSIENIVSKEYCEIDGQKNAFLLSKKEAERVAEVLQKAIKEKKSDIEINIEEAKGNDEEISVINIEEAKDNDEEISEINIEEAKDNDEEIMEIYILIVDITSRIKKSVKERWREIEIIKPLSEIEEEQCCDYEEEEIEEKKGDYNEEEEEDIEKEGDYNEEEEEDIEKEGDYNKGEEGKNKDKKTTMAGLFGPLEEDEFEISILAADTRGVNDMSYMFSGCRFVSQIKGLEKWNTSKVTDMSGMFCNCETLKELPNISEWDTSNVTDMSGMFNRCEALTKIVGLDKWNTDKYSLIFV